jgi:SanA protein
MVIVRKLLLLFCVALLSILILASVCNRIINQAAVGKLYTDPAAIPYNKVGLLLGTSKFTPGGPPNPYYLHRIEAAITLLKCGKIKYLIVSGDHREKYYNEPKQMKEDLLRLGVDSSILFIDNDGIRTFDSIVRLKEIFGQHQATIISQGFHNQRAIYIAGREGIQAIGFNAQDVHGMEGLKTHVREKFARIKVFIDCFLGSQPKTMGARIAIP